MTCHLLSFFARFRRREALWALVALVALLGTLFVIALADEVGEGDTKGFDEWVVRSLRRPDDLTVPRGPDWLREAGIDVTALGSVAVTAFVAAVAICFLLLRRQFRTALIMLATFVGGISLNAVVKHGVGRERPSVVPHLREVTSLSFPSGHAMFSAVVYLTLALLLARIVHGRGMKIYCLLVGMLLTFLVGASRVYLGVHYPTDVLAGWAVGLIWALSCWAIGDMIARRWPAGERSDVTSR